MPENEQDQPASGGEDQPAASAEGAAPTPEAVEQAQPLESAAPAAEPDVVQESAKAKKPRVRRQADIVKIDPITEIKTIEAVVSESDVDALPERVTLAAPYAFYDEAGKLNSWAAGQVVIDADEIALLVGRGVLFAVE